VRALLLLVGVATACLQGALQTHHGGPHLLLFLVALAYLAATTLPRFPGEPVSALQSLVTVGDLGLVTAVLWFSQDPQSEYYLLYYIPILHTAVRLRPRDGAAAAVLSSALYVLVLVMHASGQAYFWLAVLRSANLLAPAAILVIFVTLLKRESEVSYSLRQALHDSLRRFAAVYDVAHAANTGADLTGVLSTLLDHAAQAIGSHAGAAALSSPGEGLRVVASREAPEGEKPVDCTSNAAYRALASGEAVILDSVLADAEAPPRGAHIYLPLVTPSGPIGVLGLAVMSSRRVPRKHVDFLHSLCSEAAIAIENLQLRTDLRRLAVTDYLTGLPNRREIERRLTVETEAARRYCRPLTLLMMDCDGLKLVNDQYGHSAGDEVLCALATVLGACLRTPDSAGRVGGDEFLVILPEVTAEGGAVVGRRLISLFRQELSRRRQPTRPAASDPGLSIGVAALQAGHDSPQALQAAADSALYRAKSAGKNRIYVMTRDDQPRLDSSAEERSTSSGRP
jgi:diguanylate cyclase (GGDEF)-like protein